MPETILRDEVRRLMAEEAGQLLDVLPPDEYEAEHIAGAANIYLRRLDAATTAELDRSAPVIVYCHDAA